MFLSGGVFANVRLNQIIFELEGVEKINVHPGMTDAGLGVGAALYGYHHFRNALGLDYEPYALSNVYFGSEFSKEEIRETLESEGVIYHEPEDLNKTIAKLLAEDKVVGRFTGRMEYGPRALGNRSILYSTKDKSVNDWLNKQLDRTEFMPFAPVTLEEFADDCYLVGEGKKEPFDTARFMTITFDCTEEMKKKSPAVVHIDGTARPQVIRKEDNEDYHEILMEYQKLTGIPNLVNTSFNLHEEPIVENPAQALHAFI